MLRAGGSAADAAVATSAVLAVTTQHMCGMGGDLFALVHDPAAPGPPAVLNASGRAGSGADADRLRAEGHTSMPFRGDIRSVPVPGCVDGWLALHHRFGRLPIADVLAPAIAYARDGFPASPLLSRSCQLLGDLKDAEDFLAAGPPAPGARLRRPGVARTLEAIGSAGRDAFYRGEFGVGLLELGRGEFTPEDLAEPGADWVAPLGARVFDHDVWTAPPNSQGYLTVLGALIAEGLPLPDDTADPAWAHLLIESARAAGHDRPAVLSETADLAHLLQPDAVAERRSGVDPDACALLGAPTGDGGTIHLCAVDGDGMGVSLIQSNASGFGAHLVCPVSGSSSRTVVSGSPSWPATPPSTAHAGVRPTRSRPFSSPDQAASSELSSARWAATCSLKSSSSCSRVFSATASRPVRPSRPDGGRSTMRVARASTPGPTPMR